MPRKAKPDNLKLSELFQTRLTPDDAASFRQLAVDQKKEPSVLIRDFIKEKLRFYRCAA